VIALPLLAHFFALKFAVPLLMLLDLAAFLVFGAGLRRQVRYREIGWLLAGRIAEAEARERIWLATRRFAKRQRTWFRAEPGLVWADPARPDAWLEHALALLERGAAA